jgi:hypothetical protein
MFSTPAQREGHRQSHESTKFGRDGLPLSYGQFDQSASADPKTNCSYESFRMGKSRAPDPYVNCPYDCKVGVVSTKFRRCEGLTENKHSNNIGADLASGCMLIYTCVAGGEDSA